MKVIQLPNRRFDVHDDDGNSVLGCMGGPFYVREAAESACRMLTAFDDVDRRIESINQSLRGQDITHRAL